MQCLDRESKRKDMETVDGKGVDDQEETAQRREEKLKGTYATARYWSSSVAAVNCSTAASCSPRVA